ncbi:MAG: hypothetical protein RJA70_3074, partial [Pseudomonadota bacterium]
EREEQGDRGQLHRQLPQASPPPPYPGGRSDSFSQFVPLTSKVIVGRNLLEVVTEDGAFLERGALASACGSDPIDLYGSRPF